LLIGTQPEETSRVKPPSAAPAQVPFQLTLLVKPNDPAESLRSYFPSDPLFPLHWQNDLILRIKHVVLASRSGGKSHPSGICVECVRGGQHRPVFGDSQFVRARCTSAGTWDEDIVIQLPFPIEDCVLEFTIVSPGADPSEKDGTRALATLPLWEKGASPSAGEHK
jgi:hypothetical protein